MSVPDAELFQGSKWDRIFSGLGISLDRGKSQWMVGMTKLQTSIVLSSFHSSKRIDCKLSIFNKVSNINSSVIPGVLVGHYTQLAWGAVTRIGCGKLVSQPADSRFGQEFYICNYGLAGNLIKSEMYQIGEACSKCPDGTSCSTNYPGLCSGTPTRPLTVRPPVNVNLEWIPTRPPKVTIHKPGQGPELPELITLPPIFIESPKQPEGPDQCIYACKQNGGCSVTFSTLSFFSGSIMGSCFPPSFGGDCSGTPEKCDDCLGICEGNIGKQLTVDIDPKSKKVNESILIKPDACFIFQVDQRANLRLRR